MKRILACFIAIAAAAFLPWTGCSSGGRGSDTATGTGTGAYTGPTIPGPTGTGTVAVTSTWYAYAVPSGHNSSVAWPLVVFLHGGGTDPLNGLSAGNTAANVKSFLYIAPNSTGEDPYGRGTVKSWDWNSDNANIHECIENAKTRWYVDVKRIYVVGHSLGSTMNIVYSTGPDSQEVAAMSCFCATWPWLDVQYGGGVPRKCPAYFSSQTGDGNLTATQNLESYFSGQGHTTTFYLDPHLTGHTYDAQKIGDAFDWMKNYSLP